MGVVFEQLYFLLHAILIPIATHLLFIEVT